MLSLEDLTDILKLRTAVLAGAGAMLGFAACDPSAGSAVITALCVFACSAGAGALNNYQDRYFDALLERTRRRPLPAGRLPSAVAAAAAVLLLSAGLAGLFRIGRGIGAPLAALAAMALYNGVYTPLKKKSLLAFVPGLLSGSLPPLIGWLAGGGCFPARAAYLAALFAAWQLPHVWLQILSSGSETAHVPSFLDIFSRMQLRRLTAAWIAGFSLLTLHMKVFGLINGGAASLFVAVNALILPVILSPCLLARDGIALRGLSSCFNASFLALVIAAAADSLT